MSLTLQFLISPSRPQRVRGPRALLAAAMLALSATAGAEGLDGYNFSVAESRDGHAHMARIGLMRDFGHRWMDSGSWQLAGYWLLEAGYWDDNEDDTPGHESLFELGATPVFRLQPSSADSGGLSPYIEAGIGVHALSHTSLGDRSFSTVLQFGSHAGAGLRFGGHGEYDVGYRYQHLSNADIKTPNNGIDFHILQLNYRP